MDFNKLREITKKIGGILVMEGEKPELVILPYSIYEQLEHGYSAQKSQEQHVEMAESAPDQSMVNGEAEPHMKNPSYPAKNMHSDDALIEALNKEILALREKAKQKEEEELS